MRHYFLLRNVCLCTLLLCLGGYCGQACAGDDAQPGKCVITSGGHTYRPSGCLIRKGTDGGLSWHTIGRKDGKPLLEEILSVSIVEISRGNSRGKRRDQRRHQFPLGAGQARRGLLVRRGLPYLH